jgi:CheY-like chemotaxis protein
MYSSRTFERARTATSIYTVPKILKDAKVAHILIVDDDPGYRLLLQHILEEQSGCKYVVTLAENGKDALQQLNDQPIDLVISDVYMPEMNGIRLHRTLREIPKFERLPFLFVSGYDDQYTVAAVKNPRIEGFVRKGTSTRTLVEWVAYLTTPENERSMWPPIGG